MGWCGLAGLSLGGLGWAGLRWVGLRWGGLGWAGLGWAALGWSQKRGPEPTLQNSQTQRHGGPKRAKNGPKPDAAWRPKTPHLNQVSKSLWQCFGKAHTKAWAGLGWAGLG